MPDDELAPLHPVLKALKIQSEIADTTFFMYDFQFPPDIQKISEPAQKAMLQKLERNGVIKLDWVIDSAEDKINTGTLDELSAFRYRWHSNKDSKYTYGSTYEEIHEFQAKAPQYLGKYWINLTGSPLLTVLSEYEERLRSGQSQSRILDVTEDFTISYDKHHNPTRISYRKTPVRIQEQKMIVAAKIMEDYSGGHNTPIEQIKNTLVRHKYKATIFSDSAIRSLVSKANDDFQNATSSDQTFFKTVEKSTFSFNP